jgi:hypothetical protein
VKYRAKNLTPNPFPPLPTPLLKGEGKGIMFLAGRGVRIKASLKSRREVCREVRVYRIQSRGKYYNRAHLLLLKDRNLPKSSVYR